MNEIYIGQSISIKLMIRKGFYRGRNANNSRMLLIAKHHYSLK